MDCWFMFGKKDACLPYSHMPLIEKKYGRACPRVDLEGNNARIANWISLSIHPRFEPFLLRVMEYDLSDVSKEEGKRMIDRFITVLASDTYSRLAKPGKNPLGL